MTKLSETISRQLLPIVHSKLSNNESIRRNLPDKGGRIHIDRQLPFLVVYRSDSSSEGRYSERLVSTEAAYLLLRGDCLNRKVVSPLLTTIIELMKEEFGAFLLIEVWTNDSMIEEVTNENVNTPVFRIHASEKLPRTGFIATLKKQLETIKIRRKNASVEQVNNSSWHPHKLPSIMTKSALKKLGCTVIGLELAPIYHNTMEDVSFPQVFYSFRRQLSRALKRTFYKFVNDHTDHNVPSYHSLGRRYILKTVWNIDTKLAEICQAYDFLLQVTPVNVSQAIARFKKDKFQKVPVFQYRPLPLDPVMTKRKLFEIPIENIEDPTIERLLREKQLEVDRQLTMLMDLNTSRFFHGSMQLYGKVSDELYKTAQDILTSARTPSGERSKSNQLNAKQFAQIAEDEIDYYRNQNPAFTSRVEVRNDIYSGLMVSQGNLLIGHHTQVPQSRVAALLSHEIGTHALTYYNGKTQPFQQLHVGFAGYDEMQEGLAVLGEYLVGGLTAGRLRLLAARVIAAFSLSDGASFIDVHRLLNKTYAFNQKIAFNTTMRLFRGGGFTKDAVYLRGFLKVLEYIQKGGNILPLYIGKIASHHLPLINELQLRKVLTPIALYPRFLNTPLSKSRLETLKRGNSLEILKQSKRK